MEHKKIGLALGSGAARGWAHIGVINALEELGIKIDIVAGCSAGSLVGAAYACNKLPEFEEWVRSFGYWDVLKMLDLSWHRGGFLKGNRIFNKVSEILKIENIEECHTKFSAVATNLSDGEEVWLAEGNIRQAIRASCSIPGLFSPVEVGDRWLVDGAVVNPLPVSLARSMGADRVIAVDLQHDVNFFGTDLITHQDGSPIESESLQSKALRTDIQQHIARLVARRAAAPPSTLEVMVTSIEVLERGLKNNMLINNPADIIIQPCCPHISILDFHRAKEAIVAGRLAVERVKGTLQQFLQ